MQLPDILWGQFVTICRQVCHSCSNSRPLATEISKIGGKGLNFWEVRGSFAFERHAREDLIAWHRKLGTRRGRCISETSGFFILYFRFCAVFIWIFWSEGFSLWWKVKALMRVDVFSLWLRIEEGEISSNFAQNEPIQMVFYHILNYDSLSSCRRLWWVCEKVMLRCFSLYIAGHVYCEWKTELPLVISYVKTQLVLLCQLWLRGPLLWENRLLHWYEILR